MTFQPPPPPPGGNPPPPPPPPPPGQWGPPPGGGGGQPAFDPKNVNPLDWGILGAGLLAFIFSFVSYYTVSVSAGGFSASGNENAWHGFFGWFAMLLALAGSALVGMELFAPQVKLPWANRLLGLAAYAVATLCVILALFVYPGNVPDVSGIDRGHGVGYWLSLIVIIAGLVLSLMRVQQTGTKMPGALGNLPNIGAKGPQGGIGGQQTPPQAPPPPPGYGPPPGP